MLTMAILALAYVLLFAFERILPLRRPKAALVPRIAVNVVMSATAFLAALAIVSPVSAATMQWTTASSFGLMRILGLSGIAELLVTLILLDLSFYYWHVANHRVQFLWRIHAVHHVDPDLDVTTGFRFHFAEIALSAGFRVIQIGLIGPSLAAYAIYEVVFQLGTLFHHSNLRLPEKLERALNSVLVTPRMHGIHHSQEAAETNSNFGVVLPWWDWVHRTLRLDIPQARIAIGIPGYSTSQDNRVLALLAQPFRRQRETFSARGGQ